MKKDEFLIKKNKPITYYHYPHPLSKYPKKKPLINITKIVSRETKVPCKAIYSSSRKREHVFARQLCLVFASYYVSLPLKVIVHHYKREYTHGTHGGRVYNEEKKKPLHNSSIHHAKKAIKALCDVDKEVRELVDKIDTQIEENPQLTRFRKLL